MMNSITSIQASSKIANPEHHIIKNNQLEVCVKNHGAEMTSLRSVKTSLQYLWQAGPEWSRHAPVLFPIVGRLKGDRFTFQGKTYDMKQHGFARDCNFELTHKSADKISFQLEHSEETLKLFPFRFRLAIDYELIDSTVVIHYQVINLDRQTMFFSIGAHPAFRCPLKSDEAYEDYCLRFENPETLERTFINDQGLLTDQTAIQENNGVLPLTRTIFDRGALVYTSFNSSKVSLKNTRTDHSVTVGLSGFPQLGIWAKPGADFVCIEPWYGHADFETSDGQLENKKGIQTLKPNETFRATHSYTVS